MTNALLEGVKSVENYSDDILRYYLKQAIALDL